MIVADAERDLWIACLWRAAWDCRGVYLDHTCRHAKKRMIQEDARRWFYDRRVYVGSFLWIANTFDMNPDSLRGRLLEEAAPRAHLIEPDLSATSFPDHAA